MNGDDNEIVYIGVDQKSASKSSASSGVRIRSEALLTYGQHYQLIWVV